MSTMMVCESGPSAAPQAPCSSRNRIICSSVCAAPHSADDSVKPATASTMRRRLPKREASQPMGAVMIADAMM
jgi:hypothetical protein